MYHHKEIKQVVEELDTSITGLSQVEALMRLKNYGRNELIKAKRLTLFTLIKKQLMDAMVIILFIAAFLSFMFGDSLEGIIIIFIIIIDAFVGVWQENKAEGAIESLKKLSPSTSRVLRDNRLKDIDSSQLVIGDLVIIEEGDVVPADMRLIKSVGLRISESALTGEALAINKNAELMLNEETSLMERKNMVFSSSLVNYGHGVGIVVKTAMNTEVGKIAHMLNNTKKFDTPLKRKLDHVARVLSVIGIIICLVFIGIGLIYKKPLQPLLMMAIALAISIIPEGLPATSTIVLALGVERMAKKQTLVRNLSAVETLGCTSVICCDKTGTLTANMMEVINFVSITKTYNKNEALDNYLYKEVTMCCALCNNVRTKGGTFIGDPTEIALMKFVGQSNEDLKHRFERKLEIPFDSERKKMTTINEVFNNHVAYVKGAPEEVIKNCDYVLDKNNARLLSRADKAFLINEMEKYSNKACRIIALAKKNLLTDYQEKDYEYGLTFLGFVAMIDPPRHKIKETIELTRQAGIKTVIITGDHGLTAKMVGKSVGIIDETPILGQDLVNIDDEQLATLVKKHSVFARISPYDKLRIVRAFKSNNEVVAMTGDGVNDAPSLRAADIGTAMGKSGTDVARDAADMILLDDNYQNIIEAVFEGRRVYKNIEKVMQFLLSGNVAEIMTLLIATIFNFKFMPLLAIHILWINLVTDTLPALALGVDEASRELLKEKPRRKKTFFTRAMVVRILFHGLLISFATLLVYFLGFHQKMNLVNNEELANQTAQTMAFAVLALAQLSHAFNQRSNVESLLKGVKRHNKYLNYAIGLSLLLLGTILFIPAFKSIFGFTSLSILEWWLVFVCALIPLCGVELSKLIIRLSRKNKKAQLSA